MIRVATVKATGKKYLVINLDLRSDRVHVWGEVTKTKGLRTWHDKNKVFMRSAVDIAEVPKTQALLDELFKQSIQAVRDSGREVTVNFARSGNIRATVEPTPEQRVEPTPEQRAATNALRAEISRLSAVRRAQRG